MVGRALNVVVGIALAAIVALPGVAIAQDDPKPSDFFIESVCKSGLTKDDREIAAEFLAERGGQLRSAPPELVAALRASGLWSPEIYGQYGAEVPARLARRLSAPKDGTFRIIFDRTLLVVSSKSGKVIETVRAR
jgi:hypothetical protein